MLITRVDSYVNDFGHYFIVKDYLLFGSLLLYRSIEYIGR